jgi:hypothetical protein
MWIGEKKKRRLTKNGEVDLESTLTTKAMRRSKLSLYSSVISSFEALLRPFRA